MIELIEKLVKKDYAYISETGDVNFAVRSFRDYGKLSGKSIEQLRAGHRISIDENKRDPLDFVLWKSAKKGEPDDAIWKSSFGAGRPGWHIECSAMSTALLGNDLIFMVEELIYSFLIMKMKLHSQNVVMGLGETPREHLDACWVCYDKRRRCQSL